MHRLLPILLAVAAPLLARDARAEDTPYQLEGVEVVEHLGETVPLDLQFTDELGRAVRLGDYATGERPVLLMLGYYNCPMLCSLVLNAVVEGLKPLDWQPGVDFEMVTVSIDPTEKPELARAKKANYLEALGKPNAGDGWHFLTGEHASIKRLAEAVGFGYRYDPRQMQYAHGAVVFLLSPQGKITRYLYGIEFEPKQLRLGLTEAGEGKVGTAIDRFLLRCFHYDPDSRKYGVYVWGVMRTGGVLTVLLLGGLLLYFWRRERRA